MKYDEPEVENVALTTVHNLYNAVLLFVLSIRHNYTIFYKKANIL